MDFVIGGVCASCAALFTNPLDVLKTRMQMQGELVASGKHVRVYSNVLQAAYMIAKYDGIHALQSGLMPSIVFQFMLNSIRLGVYDHLDQRGFTRTPTGELRFIANVVVAGVCGAVGAFIASPWYLVKTQMQSRAAARIAFGYQHEHKSLTHALTKIYQQAGVSGLFRGASSSIPRAFFGSPTQLTCFAYCKEALHEREEFQNRTIRLALAGSMVSGVLTTLVMNPFDLISTRLYNQGVDASGKGLLYKNYFDCVVKVYRAEGILAFYKGIGASYLRIGPHTVLSLIFWDIMKEQYNKMKLNLLLMVVSLRGNEFFCDVNTICIFEQMFT